MTPSSPSAALSQAALSRVDPAHSSLQVLSVLLLASWVGFGGVRFVTALLLHGFLEHRLWRLAWGELFHAWLAPSLVVTVLGAAAGALLWGWLLARFARSLRFSGQDARVPGGGSGQDARVPGFGGQDARVPSGLLARFALNTHPLVVSGIPLGFFWLVLGVYEVLTLTRTQDVIAGRFALEPAHWWIFGLTVALGGLVFLARTFLAARPRQILVAALIAIGLAGLGWLANLPEAPPGRLNVLLITVDTLRVDHLSCYGYDRPTTPHLDLLASRGTRYLRSVSQAPHTHPSMASLLTSVYPTELGGELKYIPYHLPTLAEVFANAGYRTAAVSSNAWIKSALGFDQGFRHFDQTSAMSEFYADEQRATWKNAGDVTAAGLAWLAANAEKPFFLWLHYLDPHHPYEPPAPWDTRFRSTDLPQSAWLTRLRQLPTGKQTEELAARARQNDESARAEFRAVVDLYDGEIAFTDEQIGRVLHRLVELGVENQTVVAFTADHGEEFLDHGAWGHSHTLFDELIHVPLILRYPGQAEPGGVRSQLVRTLDLAPTLLTLAQLEVPKTMAGRNLLALDRARPEKDPPAVSVLTKTRQFSIESEGFKLITAPRAGALLLFNLAEDSGEQHDLAATEPRRVEALQGALEKTLGALPQGASTEVRDHMLDRATREQLEALGYVR